MSSILEPCPLKQYGEYFVHAVVLDNIQYLKIIKLNYSNKDNNCTFEDIAICPVSKKISSLGWSKLGSETEQNYMGTLLVGHVSGTISIWSIVTLIESADGSTKNTGLLKEFDGVHTSKITQIKINNKPNIIATSSNKLVILQAHEDGQNGYDLTVALNCENDNDKQEISSVQWNDKVPYILSVCSKSGFLYIWDMKKSKIHLIIKDQLMQSPEENLLTVSAWASDGVQIIIGYDNEEYSFLTQYHMTQITAPIAEYRGGHSKGIYQMTKNPNDPNFLLSLSRDNSVTCWSIRTQRNVYNKTYRDKIQSINWMNKLNDVYIVLYENGTLEANQVSFNLDLSQTSEMPDEPPRWIARKNFSVFNWSGKFLFCNENFNSVISVNQLTSNSDLITEIKEFISKNVESQDKNDFLTKKVNMLSNLISSNENLHHIEKNSILMWVTLKCIYQNDYNELYKYFGFDKEKLIGDANANIGKVKEKKRQLLKDINSSNNNNAIAFWEEIETNKGTKKETSNVMEVEKPMTVKEEYNRNFNWNQLVEKHIKTAILFGDLELAMENAFQADRDAEALLIASTNPELFAKAKAKYFSKSKDLYVKHVFSSVVNKNFNQLLDYNMKEWKEYILYGLTYLSDKEFKNFALSLGDKLLSFGDNYSGIVCYLLAGESLRIIEKLYSLYLTKIKNLNDQNDKDRLLQNLTEEIMTVHYVLGESIQNEITLRVISLYSKMLVRLKLFLEASTLLVKIKNPDNQTYELFDRIYGQYEEKLVKLIKKPTHPYNIITIKPYVLSSITSTKKNENLNSKVLNDPNVTRNNKNFGQNNYPNIAHNNNQMFNQNNNVKEVKEELYSNNQQTNEKINPNKVIRPPIVKPPVNNLLSNQQRDNNYSEPISSSGKFVNELKQQFEDKQVVINPPISKNQIIKPPIIKSNNTIKSNPDVNDNERFIKQSSVKETNYNNINTSNTNSEPVLDNDEQTIISKFDSYIVMYNSVYTDNTRQKDFKEKVEILKLKISRQEIKQNVKQLLIQFISSKSFF